MSKVFITKNGQFLSRGEGVLTQIENPDLEVNDIGVEVSEKIAEDVKEGDVLHNYLHIAECRNNSFYSYATNSSNFYKKDGELYCLVTAREGSAFVIMKYDNGSWRYHVSNFDIFSRNLTSRSNVTVTSDNKVIIAGVPRVVDNYDAVHVAELAGNRIMPYAQDRSASSYIGNTNSPGSSTHFVYVAEASGLCHCIMGYHHSETSGQGHQAFIVDTENEKLIPVHTDPSSYYRSIDDAQLIEYQNKLYMVHQDNAFQDLVTYSFNNSTSSWDFVSRSPGGYHNINMSHAISNGNLYLAIVHRYSNIKIFKFNTTTNLWDEVDTIISNWDASSYGTIGAAKLYDVSGSLRFAMHTNSNTTYNASSLGVVHELDTDTSSFNFLSSLGIRYNSLIGNGGSADQTAQQLDIIEHNGEYHGTYTYGYYGERIAFIKSDSTGSNFKRNVFWDSLQVASPESVSMHEYDGKIFTIFKDGSTRDQIGYYITSGDPSGYFVPNGGTDIFRQGAYATHFYEDGSSLYLGVGHNEFVPYQYVEDDNQFYRLDPGTHSHVSAIATGNLIRQIKIIDHSGVTYMGLSRNNSPWLETYYLDGSAWAAIPQIPKLPTGQPDRRDFEITSFNGDMFLLSPNDAIQTSSTMEFDTFKWDTSAWVEVSSSYENYDRRSDILTINYKNDGGITTFVEDNKLFAFVVNNRGYTHIYEYIDGSGWYDRPDMYPPKYQSTRMFNQTSKVLNGNVYIISGGIGLKVFKRTSSGWIVRDIAGVGYYPSSPLGVHVIGDELLIHDQQSNNRTAHLHRITDDLFNKYVWRKARDPIAPYQNGDYLFENDVLATGIALQDGSKGDIIKIRRIKR